MNTTDQIPRLILIRGVPGSGKSTTAQDISGRYGHIWIEADHFYEREYGSYAWSPERRKLAHAWCELMIRQHTEEGDSVVVSNTFSKMKEMLPYIELAESNGISWCVIECTGEYQNVHGVPQDKVQEMRNHWEIFEPDLKWLHYVNYTSRELEIMG